MSYKRNKYFKYFRNQILFFLTCFLVFAVYLTVRHCEYPLLFDFPLFINLFVPNSNDTTLYNISLSYVAAYIFYLLQVYIPDYINNQKGKYTLYPFLVKELDLIDKIICIYCESIKSDIQTIIPFNSSPIYILERNKETTLLSRFTYEKSYLDLKQDIVSVHTNLCSSPAISLIDTNLLHLISNIPLDSIFNLMDNVYKQIIECNNWEIIPNKSILQLQEYRNELVSIYGFKPNNIYTIVNSSQYETLYNNEFPKTYNIRELDFKIEINNLHP